MNTCSSLLACRRDVKHLVALCFNSSEEGSAENKEEQLKTNTVSRRVCNTTHVTSSIKVTLIQTFCNLPYPVKVYTVIPQEQKSVPL